LLYFFGQNEGKRPTILGGGGHSQQLDHVVAVELCFCVDSAKFYFKNYSLTKDSKRERSFNVTNFSDFISNKRNKDNGHICASSTRREKNNPLFIY
jgi:hypothetical protein